MDNRLPIHVHRAAVWRHSLALGIRRRATWMALALVATASTVSAQQYQAQPVDNKAGLLRPLAQEIARNPGRYAQDKDRFEEFFKKYYFPAMTQYGSDDLAKLGGLRDDLFSRFLWATRDENLQADLTNWTFEAMKPVERSSKYHPAARYNAILILGMLDTRYAIDGSAGRRPPEPYEPATEEMILIVDFAAEGKPVPPFLVVGALIGLERHAQYRESLKRETVAKMNDAVLKLATKDDILPDVTNSVANWIRVQSASVLAQLGNAGASSEIQAALAKMIAGSTQPRLSLDSRCQVAAKLATMKFDPAQGDGKALGDALLELAVKVADDEDEQAKAFEGMQIQGGGYGGAYGDSAGRLAKNRMRIDAETREVNLDVRILLTRLGDLQSGLRAVKSVVPADQQPKIDAIIAAIGPAIAAAESQDTVDLEVAESVRKMARAIHSAVKPGSAPSDEADAGDLF